MISKYYIRKKICILFFIQELFQFFRVRQMILFNLIGCKYEFYKLLNVSTLNIKFKRVFAMYLKYLNEICKDFICFLHLDALHVRKAPECFKK